MSCVRIARRVYLLALRASLRTGIHLRYFVADVHTFNHHQAGSVGDGARTRVNAYYPSFTVTSIAHTICRTAEGSVPNGDYDSIVADLIDHPLVTALKLPCRVTRIADHNFVSGLLHELPVDELRSLRPLFGLFLVRNNRREGDLLFEADFGEVLIHSESHTGVGVVRLDRIEDLSQRVLDPKPGRIVDVVAPDFGRPMTCSANLEHKE